MTSTQFPKKMDGRAPGFLRACWIYVCAAFFCGSLIAASAENSAKDVPPKPPFVTMPPPGSQWEMLITHDPLLQTRIDTASKAVKSGDHTAVVPALPLSVHVNNGLNGVIESTVRYANNRVDVYYFYKGKLLIKAVNSDRIYVITPSGEDLSSIDAYDLKQPIPGVLWVSDKYYQGKETVKMPCYVYRVKGLASTQQGADFELAAWVCVETGFPVKVQVGKTYYNYSAVRKYPENVLLPDAYLAEFKKNFGE